MLRFLNHWPVIMVFTVAAAALRIWDPAPIASLRLFVFDSYQRIQPREYNPDLPVRVVDIDDASLEAHGQWPWPRTRLAELVERLNAMGAAVIGFDFIFSEPDRTSPEQLLASLPQEPEFVRFADSIAGRQTHDQALGQALGRGQAVLGVILDGSDRGSDLQPVGSFAYSGDNPRLFTFSFTGVADNVGPLQSRAAGLGALNWAPDPDQIVRRIPMVAAVGETLFPSFNAELLRVAQGASTYVVKSSGGSGEESFGAQTGIVAIQIGDFVVPTTARGELWLRYAGTRPERYISAGAVLGGEVPADEVAGRIVIIGTSAVGLFDIRATPLDVAVPGVEIHAEGIEQILTEAFLLRPDYAVALEIALLVLLGLFVAVLIARIGPQWTGLAALALMAGANAISWFAFVDQGLLIDPVYPTVMGAGIYVAGTMVGYLRTEIERDRVRDAFGHYLAPALVEELAAHPERLTLGGELREVTILFLDIRGFTGIAETMDANALTAFMNRFLTPMTDEILSHGGTVDKYMGDAIMAFWNAPISDPDHAANACRAALAMVDRLAELNRELSAEAREAGRDPISVRIGIGINTGECCIGNLGSEQRFAYSAIGDTVNVASRLEGQTKVYGTTIIVGDTTARIAPEFAYLELDRVRVAGRSEPVRIFTLLGDAEAARSAPFGDLRRDHDAMLDAYRSCRWDDAERLVAACEDRGEPRLSTVYELYRGRIAGFREEPPIPDWDGVTVALEK